MMKPRSDVKKRAKKIKLLIMDVDGVLTPGYIIIDAAGKETKVFNVHDGFGLVLWKRAGLKSAIITAGSTPALKNRAGSLRIDCLYQKTIDKLSIYKKLKDKYRVDDENICFIGDDLIDLPILRQVGLACSVPNGHKDIMTHVHYVSRKEGGQWAVREIIDIILKTKGLWKAVTEDYFKKGARV